MKIALAADHAGYALKAHLVGTLTKQGVEVLDLGVENDSTPADYPDVAETLGKAIQEGYAERGILICGSGVGASIAANKMKGIYAAICHDAYSAAQGVQHDNMNVLCLGGRIVGIALADLLVTAFLEAQFERDTARFVTRFEKLQRIEENA